MRIDIITIFPEYFTPLSVSLLGKAAARGAIDLHVHDLRSWAHDLHRTVDDAPFGGGPGMVMSPVPWGEALDEVTAARPGPPQLVVAHPGGPPVHAGDGGGAVPARVAGVRLRPVRGDRRPGRGGRAGAHASGRGVHR